MSAFDKVIGYETIKKELLKICDIIKKPEDYAVLGAKFPHGLLLYGAPGLGKTLMAKCFIEECGMEPFIIRKTSGDGDFIEYITETFEKAATAEPSIILLDDMDKFSNEDNRHCDTEEYVAVQAGIDAVKDKRVFVIATSNDVRKLPGSLTRAGRFDHQIEVKEPTGTDARKIIEFYLSDKHVSADVNMDDLTRMISYSSCAELETIINEAAVSAVFAGKKEIGMEELLGAVLRMQYDAPDDFEECSEDDIRRRALHEAGHLVVSEVLYPESVGLASVRSSGRSGVGGFIHRCKPIERRPHAVLVSLAGKAAVELYYHDHVASGCSSDIERAVKATRDGIMRCATKGLGLVDPVGDEYGETPSESYLSSLDETLHQELESSYREAQDILQNHKVFLERVADALAEKETLLFSDIRKLKEGTDFPAK